MLPYQWKVLNDQVPGAAPSHCIENFKIAAGISKGGILWSGISDSDVAKWLEAVSYSLETDPDAELEKEADQVIDILKRRSKTRWISGYILSGSKSRECVGVTSGRPGALCCGTYGWEAGIAYYHATGKRKLLEIVSADGLTVSVILGEELENPGLSGTSGD